MKTHYVYELYNLLGTIEYVGETIDTKDRLKHHKSSQGKFYKRTDISMNIVKGFDNRKDAYQYQCQLQKQYGLITDSEIMSDVGKKNKGKPKSAEHKQKMSEAHTGKKRLPFTEEHKQKIREAAIRRYSTTNT